MDDDIHQGRSPARGIGESQRTAGETRDVVECEDDTATYRTSYDSSTEPVGMAVISTVATVAETDPMDLEPLYSAVDPDALNALFESPATDASRDDIRVTFAFHGHEVTVYSSGVITVRQPQETSSA